MSDVTTQPDRSVTRPLTVLIPLIQEDLAAAKKAGMEYYRGAGEKLNEAKAQLKHGAFVPWVKKNFNISISTAHDYMALAHATSGTQKEGRPQYPSLNEFNRATGRHHNETVAKRPWHDPIKDTLNKVDTETLNLRKAELARRDEREAERKLALQLIDIGYKALATKLHPDKGGSRDAMSRLNTVRDRLRASI